MNSTKSRWLAAISVPLVWCAAADASASKNPTYGGILRVQLRAPFVSLDPREWKAGSLSESGDEKLAGLVYDRLVTLDDYGQIQPSLAKEWSHDTAFRTWQFKLRSGVKFSDGTALASSDVATSLHSLLPEGFQIGSNEGAVTLRASRPVPDLLELLATGRYFIFHLQADHTLVGTGPFFVAESTPPTPFEANPTAMKPARIEFRASQEAWAGRPFLDGIDVSLGQPALRQMLDLQTGRSDVVEIAPDLVRKSRQENLRLWKSDPNILLALRFDDAQPATQDERLREALAFSLDRETMANVLLQRQAEPTAALLPQWLSGYAFLFEAKSDPEQAKKIRASLPANEANAREPLRLRVDAVGDIMRLLGERVSVNARQANLIVQVVSHAGTIGTTSAPIGLHLFAWHYETVVPRVELQAMTRDLGLAENVEGIQGLTEVEQLYSQERHILEERYVLPLVMLPEYVGLGANVRNWMPARWGQWRLADVWLEQSDTTSPKRAADGTAGNDSETKPGRRP